MKAMELKVWVEGIQRIVCGVTETTTCQDVVYALAHATGKTGRFTLIERWRNNERLLAPQEHPLTILMKWGEYSNDVQLILQRSGGSQQSSQSPAQGSDSVHGFSPSPSSESTFGVTPERNKDIRKSLTFSGGHDVQSLAERRAASVNRQDDQPPAQNNRLNMEERSSPSQTKPGTEPMQQQSNLPQITPVQQQQQSIQQTPSQQVKRDREAPPYRAPPPGPAQVPRTLPLPPYRDPPPPTHSPARGTPPRTPHSPTPASLSGSKPKRTLFKDFPVTETDSHHEAVLYNTQYRDLLRLVNYQRDKLSSQQAELTKFDAEIVFWEGKSQEQKRQIEIITQETMRMEAQSKQGDEQLRALGHVEEESELVRQQEKTLKSEITLLRSKLANCETELLQCKNKIRLLTEDSQMEQRVMLAEREKRQQLERSLLTEVERLQRQLELAKQTTEQAAHCGDELRREVAALESAISDKKQQVEQLVSEMKEANLKSLAIAPAEELKHLLEGPHKPGSTRKMVGSPRQLENAVPTSKNPHGVWV